MTLRADLVGVGYPGNGQVLEGTSLSLVEGEALALMGPNGSGKTTLIRLLAGLLRPERGRVLLGDQELAGMSRKAVARDIAVVPQGEGSAFSFAVEEVVKMGRYPHLSLWSSWGEKDTKAVEESIDRADLEALRRRPADKLSGGERQRAVLARGLAQQARFLLLDEPTSHLDLHHVEDLVSLLKSLKARGLGLLIATHDLAFAKRVADRAVVMRKGGRTISIRKNQITRARVMAASA